MAAHGDGTVSPHAMPVASAIPDMALARELFAQLGEISADGIGITRDTYGPGEQQAHDVVRRVAERLGLAVRVDAALNLYMTLPGRNPALPAVVTGSHLDSVPRGGNFDGAAGVVAGLAIVAGWRAANYVPAADTVVVALRAEESAWFPVSYIGSKSALGRLPAGALTSCRSDDGSRLADRLQALGGDPAALARGEAGIDVARIARFCELHIEQGPVLIEAGEPVGVVTGICGSVRFRSVTATGDYAHSGATPRSHRRDAVLATSWLVARLHEIWIELENGGHEMTLTVGRFATDPAQADISKVAGRVEFGIDVRSRYPDTLFLAEQRVLDAVAAATARFGVSFDLGERSASEPARMDDGLRGRLRERIQALGLPQREMPSGAGHDAALFAAQGVPTAMIFVRNAHGSHNPDEAMDLEDFALGTTLLQSLLDDA